MLSIAWVWVQFEKKCKGKINIQKTIEHFYIDYYQKKIICYCICFYNNTRCNYYFNNIC